LKASPDAYDHGDLAAPKADALLHHSDRGSQYTSERFQRLMADHGVTCSMSRAGDVWDNAAMESFLLAQDRAHRAQNLPDSRRSQADMFDYIERFYNPKRRHSMIGYMSPYGRRDEGWFSLSACHPNRVQATEPKSLVEVCAAQFLY
jgi:transposase InsO family protein